MRLKFHPCYYCESKRVVDLRVAWRKRGWERVAGDEQAWSRGSVGGVCLWWGVCAWWGVSIPAGR